MPAFSISSNKLPNKMYIDYTRCYSNKYIVAQIAASPKSTRNRKNSIVTKEL